MELESYQSAMLQGMGPEPYLVLIVVQTSNKIDKSWGLSDSMVAIVNNIVLCISKLLREQITEVLIKGKKQTL